MTLQLYAHPFSSYCQKVLIALYENDVPFTFRMLEPSEKRTLVEFAKLSPMRRMPVLVDGERVVLESSVIIEYLGLYHPGPVPLIPADAKAALEVRMLDRAFDNYIMGQMQKFVFDRIRRRMSATPPACRRPPACSTAPMPGWTASWRDARGQRAMNSAWPTAPPPRRCSTPTGFIPSHTSSPICATIAGVYWRARRSPAPSTRRGPIARSFRRERRIATSKAQQKGCAMR